MFQGDAVTRILSAPASTVHAAESLLLELVLQLPSEAASMKQTAENTKTPMGHSQILTGSVPILTITGLQRKASGRYLARMPSSARLISTRIERQAAAEVDRDGPAKAETDELSIAADTFPDQRDADSKQHRSENHRIERRIGSWNAQPGRNGIEAQERDTQQEVDEAIDE
jgi:hypothetical protein